MVAEIKNENLSENEITGIVERFEESQGRFCTIRACGCCGIKKAQRGNSNSCHQEINLNQSSILQYNLEDTTKINQEMTLPTNKIPIDSNENWKNIKIWKIRSVYIHKCKEKLLLYHLHPELVHINQDKDTWTYLCGQCYQSIVGKNKIP